MIRSFEHLSHLFFDHHLSRRDWLRFLLGGWALYLARPDSKGEAAEPQPACRGSILQQFLGEELHYRIGFWLFPHCGDARTRFMATENPGLYRASLEGRTVGFIDWLLGGYRYAHVSYLEFVPGRDRLRPRCFQLTKKRMEGESRQTVIFDYPRKEVTFSLTLPNGKSHQESMPMQEGIIYEDYLTLFYNFRYGNYGPLEQGRTYNLPLRIHKEMSSLELSIASQEEEEKHRKKESNKSGKHFFLRFRVNGKDVSSQSGEIEGWLSRNGVPTKGTIKDVAFFGDLWGELIQRNVELPPERWRGNNDGCV